jgi:thiamine transport system substrate-binding protein
MRRGAALLAALAFFAGCGNGDGGDGGSSDPAPTTVTLVAYDSFLTEGTGLATALAEFTEASGITVDIVRAGDTGTMVTKAVLTAGNPEGDVLWGVDSTFLSAATAGKIFDGEPVKVNYGDVCVNYDVEWFAERGIAPPDSFEDFVDPTYRGLLAVQNPSSSSVGLAFTIGTIDTFGDGWLDYWSALRDNDVLVTESWDTSYFEAFTRAGGDRPIVISYGSSPPYEVLYADPPRTDAPTAVVEATCVRQFEYAGVLRGSERSDAARQLVDFLVSERFQRELPLSLFVYPVDQSATLPEAFTTYTVIPDRPIEIDPDAVRANRERWQDEWTTTVLR